MKKGLSSLLFLCKIFIFAVVLVASVLLLSKIFSEKTDLKASQADVEVKVDKRPVVILDPGHGGMDSGAVSVYGDEEKHINLAVAKYLGEFLEEAGVRVVYTRTEDVMLQSDKTASRKMGDLMARVDLAKENEGAIFVSIHMNTLAEEKYKGLQVFYSQNEGSSKALALQIQNDAKALLQPENHREVKDAKGSIFVLDRLDGTAVLVECGFLSNKEEALLLKSEEYQKKLAFVLSRSVISFTLQKENLE